MSHRARVWIALWSVYLIWGSTYLGIELAGETIPPLFAVAWRFVIAGPLMAAWVAWRRGPGVLRVRPVELASSVLIGALLPGANALLFVAERSVPIGLAALIIAAVPLWLVVLRLASGERPPALALLGVAVALVLGALVLHEHLALRELGGAAIIVASVAIVVRREVPAEPAPVPVVASRT